MRNLTLLLSFIRLLFTNRKELLKSLYGFSQETISKNAVINEHKLPKGIPVIDITELIPDFNETISSYSYLDGTSRAIDICILKSLAKNIPNCQYIEFGTWRGESLVNVAEVANKAYSISFSEEQMKEYKLPEPMIRASRFFSKNHTNIVEIKANTLTYDFSSLEKKFDLIFVDADHEYLSVKKDTENAFKLLKDENSIIVWHDYGRSYESINWQVLRGIIEGSPKHAFKNIYRVSNSICAIYTTKKYKSSYPTPHIPSKSFTINISAKRV